LICNNKLTESCFRIFLGTFSLGICLPRQECEAYGANDIQNVLRSLTSLDVDVQDITVRCCEDQVCNRPSTPDPRPSPGPVGNVTCMSLF